MDINIDVKKPKYRGWIQDYNGDICVGRKKTIQHVILEQDSSSLIFNFDCVEEWQRFIDFFNITDVKDFRQPKD